MSAEILRRAAALMRERAGAATWTLMPWGVDEVGAVWAQEADGQPVPISSRSTDNDAEHIASWHPVVALAVADWLEQTAGDWQLIEDGLLWSSAIAWDATKVRALAVARAYLGDER